MLKEIDHVFTNRNVNLSTLVVLLILMSVPHAVFSQDRLDFTDESTVYIDGTSNHSDWTVTADSLYGWVAFSQDDDGRPVVTGAELHVLAEEIVSERGIIMNRLMYTALKTGEFSEIVFQLTGANPLSVPEAVPDSFAVSTTGVLSIAGVSNEIEVIVGGNKIGSSGYEFGGSYGLKMTDYGMTPPTALFGSLHTGNPVVVRFNLVVKLD